MFPGAITLRQEISIQRETGFDGPQSGSCSAWCQSWLG